MDFQEKFDRKKLASEKEKVRKNCGSNSFVKICHLAKLFILLSLVSYEVFFKTNDSNFKLKILFFQILKIMKKKIAVIKVTIQHMFS